MRCGQVGCALAPSWRVKWRDPVNVTQVDRCPDHVLDECRRLVRVGTPFTCERVGPLHLFGNRL